MARNLMHIFGISGNDLLILNELNGEKQAKRTEFFL
jgi:hypothetical protein